ncbi:dUTP diphosphatase [Dethiosulfovibrio sp. F2B]|uniref:dUTP diphosphatase n=1 Tax=Dethiosulfovibrio faecalis TaxID=2720018 RepID=UPI001F33950C|nr:dUTP diphosphatase [Dethiosulfovibrio faecalis]MCF4152128.1 dUTP diphosphatase [Dethiosulfovibrio faecalis]
MEIRIPVVREGEALRLPLPGYETSGSAGMDLIAAESVVIPQGKCMTVGTGLRIAVPDGFEAQVRPRSGLALKRGLVVPNSPGTIDSDYRGEIRVIMMNLGDGPFEVAVGDRIAQLVIAPVARACWEEVATLESTERGSGGFGSTGISTPSRK